MTRDIIRVNIVFVLLICLILLFSALIYLQLFASVYLKEASAATKEELNNVANQIADRLKRNSESSLVEFDGNYVFFVIDGSDGSYVFGRKGPEEIDEQLWERYRTKLIYEMQKQKKGWIFYPERKPLEFYKHQRIIRYLTIDRLGWIVAVETILNSNLSLLAKFFNWNLISRFLMVFFIGVGLIYYITHRYFQILRKNISDTIEQDIFSVGAENVWSPSAFDKKLDLGGTFESPANSIKPAKEERKPAERNVNIQKSTDPSIDLATEKTFSEDKKQEALGLGHLELGQVVQESSFKSDETKKNDNISKENKESDKNNSGLQEEDNASLDDLTLNVKNIKSPLLKKIINQIRKR